MIIDTSVLFALLVRSDPHHEVVVEAVQARNDDLVVSPLVLAELDHLLRTRGGSAAELAGMRELASGAWHIPAFTTEDLADTMHVVEKFADLDIGATDASLVVLAQRFRTHTIATLDRRHFGALRALDGKPFEIVPQA